MQPCETGQNRSAGIISLAYKFLHHWQQQKFVAEFVSAITDIYYCSIDILALFYVQFHENIQFA